ncbi:molecular chaperone [Hortaea werneckii]|nr:molecular chaperone [Hortaea werneckii]
MSSEYNYDADAQFFPFFVLTVSSLITLPLTYTLLRSPSDVAGTSKAAHIASPFNPKNADIIQTSRAKQKRKELRLKRMLIAATGWLTMAYMIYLMYVTARAQPTVWNPYDILDIGMSASEKQINSRYRKLSVTMHPDKRQPNPALNETVESINDAWVEIVKAYKALTDEEIRNNYIQYGNPDGKQSTSFGIALPSILVAEGSGKYVLVFYGALLGIGLPWLVGKWWYGMQKMTRERVLVTSAGNMFTEYRERMDDSDVVNAVSSALEYRDVLHGTKEHSGLGKLEKLLLQASEASAEGESSAMKPKDRKRLEDLDDPVRRKTFAMVWAYLTRLDLDDRTLEAEKFELAPTALQLNEAFLSICLAYGFTAPVLSSYRLSQSLVQAVPPTQRLPLMQLPHFTPSIIRDLEQKTTANNGSKDHMTIQSLMALPAEQRQALAQAAGLTNDRLKVAENVARQLPYLRVEKAFFKVQGEKFIIPSSLVQFVVKARFIPPGSTKVPPVTDEDLKDVDPAEGDIQAQKQEQEQHPVPLAHAPYLARERAPRWHIFLHDTRQGKIAVPPFTFAAFDKQPFEVADSADGSVKPTYNVVTLKMQFQAPPQPGEYKFQMQMVCDSYLGFDHRQEAVMVIEEASKAQAVDDESDISEPEEDSIAGAMATMRGQPTSNPAEQAERDARRQARREANERKKLQAGGGPDDDEESDYESGTDEDEESDSETDTETDTDEE